MKKISLSVAIITKNEEENLKKLLPIINQFAEELVIVDNYSDDKSEEIANLYGCKFIKQEWMGFSEQKNFAFQHCKNDWILSLDADEIPDEILIAEIISIIDKNNIGAYKINRYTHYLGKLMKYSWQSDLQLRLVHKSKNPVWVGGEVHESLKVDGEILKTKGILIHYSYKDISHHFQKTIQYAELGAIKYLRLEKKVSLINLIINPTYAFVNMYLIKFGFLDGWRGLVAAFSSMTGTFLKYGITISKMNKK